MMSFDKNIKQWTLLDFFNKEYAQRKFELDCKSGHVCFDKFIKCFWTLIRFIIYKCGEYEEYSNINGVYRNTQDVINSDAIYNVYGEYQSQLSNVLNVIIIAYNNSLTSNPNEICEQLEISNGSDEYIYEALHRFEKEVKFLRDTCVNYGYFPHDLTKHIGICEIITMFINDSIPIINNFIQIGRSNENYFRINYISSDRNCCFENEIQKSFYFYLNTNEIFSVDYIIQCIKVAMSRVGKRNYKSSHKLGNLDSNIQICIDYRNQSIENNNFFANVKAALSKAIFYCDPEKINTEELFSAYWHDIHRKHKKISEFNRIIGLFIWDCENFYGIGINEGATILATASTEYLLPIAVDDIHYKLKDAANNFFRAYYQAFPDKKNNGSAIEINNLLREYRLAVKCIQTQEFASHAK